MTGQLACYHCGADADQLVPGVLTRLKSPLLYCSLCTAFYAQVMSSQQAAAMLVVREERGIQEGL